MYSVIVRSGASDLLLFSLIISSIYEAQTTRSQSVNVGLDDFWSTYLATYFLNVCLCAPNLHLFLGDIGRGLRNLLGQLAVLRP